MAAKRTESRQENAPKQDQLSAMVELQPRKALAAQDQHGLTHSSQCSAIVDIPTTSVFKRLCRRIGGFVAKIFSW